MRIDKNYPNTWSQYPVKKDALLKKELPSPISMEMTPRSPEADKALLIPFMGNDRKPKIYYSDPEYFTKKA